MKLPPLNLTKRQKWYVRIAIGLIIAVPMAYIINFMLHPISNSSSDWGTFGDFIGGLLNPLISFLTLIVTIIIAVTLSELEKRYHDETVNSPVKPYFSIGSADFFSADISAINLTVEQDYYSYKPPTNPAGPHDHFNKQFHLRIFNKGLGAATEVVAKFEINLAELKQILTFNHQNITLTTTDIQTDEDGRTFMWVHVASNHFNYQGNIKIYGAESRGLGLVENRKKAKAPVPSQMISAFQLHNLKRRLNIPVGDFPTISVTLYYKNIHEKSLESKFRVGLVNVQDYPTFSRFRLLQEPI